LNADDVEHALLADKTLLQAWSLRGAPHVFPTRDQPVFLHALAAKDERSIRAFVFGVEPALDTVGLTAVAAVQHAADALKQVLEGRRMTKDELGVEMAEWIRPRLTASQQRQWKGDSWYAPGQTQGESIVRFLLPILSLRGLCCHAERRGAKAYLARTTEWLGPTATASRRPPARSEIVRRYLRCFGPSTRQHFAEWAGVGESHAVDLWALVAPDLVEVDVEGRTAWLQRPEVPRLTSPPEPRGIRFLPPHDPYLALRDRGTIVSDGGWQRRLWRTSGNPGVVLADGQVVAAWRPKASKTRLHLTIEWMAPATRRVKARAEEEAAPLAAFRGFKSVKVTCQ
jgi:hypothetical protein